MANPSPNDTGLSMFENEWFNLRGMSTVISRPSLADRRSSDYHS